MGVARIPKQPHPQEGSHGDQTITRQDSLHAHAMTSWHPNRVGYVGDISLRNDNRHTEGVGKKPLNGYKRVGHFTEAGVEKQSGATGFAYGSETYDQKLARGRSWHGHKLDNRT